MDVISQNPYKVPIINGEVKYLPINDVPKEGTFVRESNEIIDLGLVISHPLEDGTVRVQNINTVIVTIEPQTVLGTLYQMQPIDSKGVPRETKRKPGRLPKQKTGIDQAGVSVGAGT